LDDGRFNNNGWLQECPDPITKLTWDNAFLISPKLGKELGVIAGNTLVKVVSKNPNAHKRGKEQGHIIKVSVDGRILVGPAHVQPGLPDNTIVVSLGYGRTVTGNVGEGSGFNAYTLRTSSGQSSLSGATAEIAGGIQELADTQEHWSMEGRAIIREANLDFYEEHPDFVDHMGMESHSPPVLGLDENGGNRRDTVPLQELIVNGEENRGNSAYVTPKFTGDHQWGMSIDLNTCTGCNACVIACQSENNIPVVGREQVRRGREMHWIRLDRYYSAGPGRDTNDIPDNPQVSLQPMTCQHCETAPCESVCPVNATVHDEEGLNVMAYNRCVGTRYCANNCPYKVRRFNFFDWNDRDMDRVYEGPLGPQGMDELKKMSKNPEVSVRMRGVMEKCTYCTQRIEAAKISQKVEARDSDDVKVPDGTIKTACQQVCPAGAIVFGDVADPESEVSKLKVSNRDYGVLGYLNTRPRTTYLAKLRNPNPLMPDYYDNPLSHLEYNAINGHGEGHGDEHTVDSHAAEDGGHNGH
jgi:molybdopterin-containing oxidoreductase family iron-sulfur binding subunit